MSTAKDIEDAIPNEDLKIYERAMRDNVDKIAQSDVFVSMLNGRFDDPLMLMQFGIAMMMDKPIHLMVNKGTKIPEHVRKAADSIHIIDYDNQDEMIAAMKEITGK